MSSDNPKNRMKNSSDGASEIIGGEAAITNAEKSGDLSCVTDGGEVNGEASEIVAALPAPIKEQIFSSLPVKCILRTAKPNNSSIVVRPLADPNSKKPLIHEFRVVVLNDFELEYPIKTLAQDSLLIGCCNGIVAIYVDATTTPFIFLWNPATGASKDILTSRGSSLAIVYDEVTEDIKLVRMSNQGTYVCSIKDGNWKLIKKSIEFNGEEFMCAATVKGNSYWIMDDELLKFDINREEFAKFPLMDSPWSYYTSRHKYVNFYDSLGYIVLTMFDKPNSYVHLYVLDEDSAWIEKITVGPLTECVSEILEFSNDGQIVARSGSDNRLLCISPKTRETTSLPINFPVEAANFRESLVDLGPAKSASNSA